MIYLIMLIFLLIIGDLWLVHKWYKWEKDRDEQDQDERILQLEKRVEDYRRNGKLMYGALLDTVNDYHEELDEEIKIIKKQLKKRSDKE